MKTPALVHSPVEVLEDRIAPALLVHGANLLGGAGNPSSGETSVGENAVTIVEVNAGQAMVWYNGITARIESISFGPNANLEVTGDVLGDLVGNLEADGTLSDADANPVNGEDGSRLLSNNLAGFKSRPLGSLKGSVGNVITGGSVSGLSIAGEIAGIYAGDGVFRAGSICSRAARWIRAPGRSTSIPSNRAHRINSPLPSPAAICGRALRSRAQRSRSRRGSRFLPAAAIPPARCSPAQVRRAAASAAWPSTAPRCPRARRMTRRATRSSPATAPTGAAAARAARSRASRRRLPSVP